MVVAPVDVASSADPCRRTSPVLAGGVHRLLDGPSRGRSCTVSGLLVRAPCTAGAKSESLG